MKKTCLTPILLSALLQACGGTSSSNTQPAGLTGSQQIEATSMDVMISSPAPNIADGTDTNFVTATVYIPAHAQGEPYPLVIHGHGWGGDRYSQADVDANDPEPGTSTTSMFSLIDQRVEVLWNAGYAVVSFDQRGFGRGDDGDNGTSDGAHAMDPRYEVQDAIAVLDWAVANLDLVMDGPGDPRVGSIGGSYGGGYQLLMAAVDARLDAITPSGTWYDFAQSLSPNRVIKKGYSAGLCVLAQTDGAQLSEEVQGSCDEAVTDQTTRFQEELTQRTQDIFLDHGMNVYEETPGFVLPPVDALVIQGNRDILFNFNQAADNFAFLSSAGDARLITQENGHSLSQLRFGPGSQGALGNNTCGGLDTMAAIKSWFDQKLKGLPVSTGLPARVCISLDDNRGALLNEVPVGNPGGNPAFRATIADATLVQASQHNNTASETGEALFVPIGAPISGDGFSLAGIPIANVSIDPALVAEGVVFMGTGIQRGGSTFLVDQQVVPVRSSDERAGAMPEPIRLVGIGEKLEDGDVVGVLLYGQFDQFENEARSLYASNAANIAGTVDFPIVEAAISTLNP